MGEPERFYSRGKNLTSLQLGEICQLFQLLERHSILQETSQCFTEQGLPYDQRDRHTHIYTDQTRILWIIILLWSWLQPAQTNQHLARDTSLLSGPWTPDNSATLRINQIYGPTFAPLLYSTPGICFGHWQGSWAAWALVLTQDRIFFFLVIYWIIWPWITNY